MSERAQLFRMPVTITGEPHPLPDGPDGLKLFGLSDNATKVAIGLAHSGKDRVNLRDRQTVSLDFAVLSDDVGLVLSATLRLRDHDGRLLECISAMIAQEDVERIARAASALFQLTPKPGDNA